MKKAGIIGCGGISQVHCAVLAGMDDVELAAVCDVAEEKAVTDEEAVFALRLLDFYVKTKTEEKLNSMQELLKL